jgi:hypothetical protein
MAVIHVNNKIEIMNGNENNLQNVLVEKPDFCATLIALKHVSINVIAITVHAFRANRDSSDTHVNLFADFVPKLFVIR